jgi:hypothetical protein
MQVVQFLSLSFATVYELETLSLWESRALRPGEGQFGKPIANIPRCDKTLPGRYRVRPSREREGNVTSFSSIT